jgi:zinc transport system substrate-binding protein
MEISMRRHTGASFALSRWGAAPAVALAAALAFGPSCGGTETDHTPDEFDDGPLSVYVVNFPLQYFAERIGGDHVEVAFPAPRDVDPAFWQPAPDVVAEFQSADLIVLNGAGYASWMRHATLPRKSLVDTASGFGDQLISQEDSMTHGHGPSGQHSHAGTAFTTWLDPTLATLQARAIAAAMIAHRPKLRTQFETGLAALEADLRELDSSLQRATRPLRSRALIFSHPVYQYFARRYELAGDSLHWEPDEMPAESEWRSLEARSGRDAVEILFFESAPLPEIEARLETLGIHVIVFKPAGRATGKGDWLAQMHENLRRLSKATGVSALPTGSIAR